MSEQVVDAEVVPEEQAPDVEPHPPQTLALSQRPGASTALIAAATAHEKVEIATEIATTLDAVIKAQGLRTKIGRRKQVDSNGREQWVDAYHVNVEGWQTLATFLDLAVVPVWTRQVADPETGQPRRVTYPVKVTRTRNKGKQNELVETEEFEVDGYDWESRVEVYKDGVLIAGAEAMVTRSEDSWKRRDDHALRSMAQTRAMGKAIAGAARWVVALAGYSGTPAEEMPREPEQPSVPPLAQPASDELKGRAVRALTYLMDGDATVAEKAWGTVKAAFEGQMPAGVALALTLCARALLDSRPEDPS